ncbi:hypothetical protein NDU88_011494, partial [Pleurodeles waltl]
NVLYTAGGAPGALAVSSQTASINTDVSTAVFIMRAKVSFLAQLHTHLTA